MAIYNNNKKRNLAFESNGTSGLGSADTSPYLWITIGLIVVLMVVAVSYVFSGRLLYRTNAYDEGLKNENQIKLKKFKGFKRDQESDGKESSAPPSYPSSPS